MTLPPRRARNAASALLSTAMTFALVAVACVVAVPPAGAGASYTPITPSSAGRPITLTGRDLTIDEIVQVARYGAKVSLGAAARQREADNYGLLLEAAAEGIPVYWFNRGAGEQRETVIFAGDPMSAENRAIIEKGQSMRFRGGAMWGTGPEVNDEEIVRAMMVVRANAMVYNAPSPAACTDAARPAERPHHAGGAVPRHPGRG